ncbi:MAG: 16S rRNA (cytidine(1402)-2'-O)-methyltransferase [Bacteroidetes bacterium]|nr:MAG: 16S rRNA (cytidine(1402)-2'-O)-methyltransferase [Bacteroidota bacterium]RLD82173.1 MAG: 16S rRNA (cytidine(1402)-2'-O)-methyltransferase [Bacteroidota bacterium]
MLYIVPTPIGNLADITKRAIDILGEVDFILAEDTRTSGNLMKHLGISKPMMAYHQHNEHKVLQKVIDRLKAGETAALVSDAGTPGISDPAFLIIRECIKESIELSCLPGPTAFVPALVGSGLPCDRFVFEGFLPHKKGRQTRLQNLLDEKRTMVFYESPHRILKTLKQFVEVFGEERQASVSREISKIYEETVRGSLPEIIAHFETNPLKGEFVIVLSGC